MTLNTIFNMVLTNHIFPYSTREHNWLPITFGIMKPITREKGVLMKSMIVEDERFKAS